MLDSFLWGLLCLQGLPQSFFSTKMLPRLASKSILDKYYLQALILSLPLQDMHTNSHSHIPMKKHPMEDADCNTMIKK